MGSDQVQFTVNADELRALIRDVVEEVIVELVAKVDPDEGLTFAPDFADSLRAYLQDKPDGRPAGEVFKDLGLDVG